MMTIEEVNRRKAERERKKREARLRRNLEAAERNRASREAPKRGRYQARVHLPPQDGCVFVVTDMHYYPGDETTLAHKAALALAAELHPWAVINNGDAIDGASISRWPVGSFSSLADQPTVAAEIAEAARQLADFEALPYVEYLLWNLGNHDARFETRLADKVPEFAEVNGFELKDHFPGWAPAWATWIGDEVVVKHRFRGGMHAAQNNALWAGKTMVTGHTHRLRSVQLTDYSGDRWGVEAGTMSPIYGKHFLHYTEDNPVNWQQGFCVLTFRDRKLLPPEFCTVLADGRVCWRGELLDV